MNFGTYNGVNGRYEIRSASPRAMAQFWTVCLCLGVLSGTGVLGQLPTVYMYNNCGSSIDVSNTGYISWSTGSYSNYVDCHVVLLAPTGTTISLQFPTVNIEGSSSCIDYLYVYNGEYYSAPGFYPSFYVCNANQPGVFSSTGNHVTLRLKTDSSVTGSFQVLYSVLGSSSPTVVPASDRIRLVGGSTTSEGRLEVRPANSYVWGTVCDDSFDAVDAQVACRTLGYATAIEYRDSAAFGQGSGQIYMDDLECSGTESSLFDCSYRGWGVHDCGHGEDVGVVCATSAVITDRIRLVGGSTSYEGRVEVRPVNSYTWGTVCDDSFDLLDANVICRSLGYAGAQEYRGSASFGQGSGPIYMDDLACTGTEISLFSCSYPGWGVENCGHSEDVGVVCTSSGQGGTGDSDRVRLVGGTSASEGRLEVRPDNSDDWGTVCDDDFGTQDGNVVCRMLGYSSVYQVHDRAYYGQGSGNIYMDDLDCSGSESSLFDCSYPGWGIENCGHSEDVGIECNISGTSGELSGGAIAGIVIGVLLSICLLATLIACACKSSSSSSSAPNRVIPATHGRQNIAMTANTIVHQPTVVAQTNLAYNPGYNPQQISTVYQPYPPPPQYPPAPTTQYPPLPASQYPPAPASQYPPPPAYTDALGMPTQPPGGNGPQLQPLSSQLYPLNDPAHPPTYIPPQPSQPYSGVPPPVQPPPL
ncbi:soluble scavenger receptor cysteine-rich domain-containing protein SSC5D-like [Branchiostoma lanceolatum]|uniref:soluble scavenger receptor cysteine-rich domain-containing protein SSC5D-like n=1 Tax=Branchiostoma lanceolatum TaxID=7740 RepID=UPI00345301D4